MHSGVKGERGEEATPSSEEATPSSNEEACYNQKQPVAVEGEHSAPPSVSTAWRAADLAARLLTRVGRRNVAADNEANSSSTVVTSADGDSGSVAAEASDEEKVTAAFASAASPSSAAATPASLPLPKTQKKKASPPILCVKCQHEKGLWVNFG